IEKAHPEVLKKLSSILQAGYVCTSNRETNIKQTLFVMTSNLPFDQKQSPPAIEQTLYPQLRERFQSKDLSYIQQIIPFYSLGEEQIRTLIQLQLGQIFEAQELSVEVSDDVKNTLYRRYAQLGMHALKQSMNEVRNTVRAAKSKKLSLHMQDGAMAVKLLP